MSRASAVNFIVTRNKNLKKGGHSLVVEMEDFSGRHLFF
jgi:hypothetical protein